MIKSDHQHVCEELERLRAENARLTDAYEAAARERDQLQATVDEVDSMRHRHLAENARLREALEEICDGIGCTNTYSGCNDHCKDIARAALEPEANEKTPGK